MIPRQVTVAVFVGMVIGLLLPQLVYVYFITGSPQCPGKSELERVQWRLSYYMDSIMNNSLIPIPQHEQNQSQLSSEANKAGSDCWKGTMRPVQRKLLFVGVITAVKYLETRAVGINNTWGRELPDLHFFVSQPSINQNVGLPTIILPGTDDTQYPPQQKVFHMLKYMHDHYIDEFDFFMRSDDDVYVKTDLLLELLQNINPAQDIYMGCPGFGRPDDKSRIKLQEKEHYCMGGPGVIFSRSALKKLAPHLDSCLKVGQKIISVYVYTQISLFLSLNSYRMWL